MPHIHTEAGQIDMTSEVFVVYENTVLLRLHDKYKLWLSVGGHIELDEDPNEAAIREVKEEVGLDIQLYGQDRLKERNKDNQKDLVVPFSMNRHTISPTHDHVTLTYFATANTSKVVPESSHDQWHWFTMQELEENKFGIQANIVRDAMAALRTLGRKGNK
jgi:8-oxo-dGTP pyrophosphatase MutT (NUDIX family)